LAGAAGVLGAGMLVWLTVGSGPTSDAARLSEGDGERIYAANCASCHGAEGQGEPKWRQRKANGRLPAPPLNGSGHTWHHPDPQLVAIVTHGVAALAPDGYESDMAGFGERLSEREIKAVLAFVKTWWPEEARARQRQITDQAASRD
jgi:mono/diheme cytochrome c family protein